MSSAHNINKNSFIITHYLISFVLFIYFIY